MLDTPIDRTIETFRACLDKSEQVEAPWRHWLLEKALPEDVIDRVSSFAGRFTGPEMRDLTKSFVKFAQVSFEEAMKKSGDADAMDRLREILERATREMEEAGSGRRRNGV